LYAVELEVQKAVFTNLEADGVITAAGIPIYDDVPQDSVYPYIVIGDDTGIEWDTNDTTGIEATITIHAWSRERGRKQVKTIMGYIYDALHRKSLAVSGLSVVDCVWEFSETLVETDNITRHGVTRFRITAEKGA
jgi:hypothetical protein